MKFTSHTSADSNFLVLYYISYLL